MSPLPPSAGDLRHLARTVDALTTQVRRLADGRTTPTDAPTTTPDDGPSPIAGRIEVRQPCPYCGDRQMIPRHQFAEHVARLHSDVRTGGPGIPVPPADDEDAQRTNRRVSLRVLINRANRGLALTASEAQLLTRHVATEICDANDRDRLTAELEAAEQRADGFRTERDQAHASIERVRHVAALIETGAPWTANHDETARRIRAALALTCACTYGERCPACRD